MKMQEQVYAPRPVRRTGRCQCSHRRTFDLEIQKDPKPVNFIQSTTPSSESSCSLTSQESEISYSSFEKDLQQENVYEEINKILSNDFLFDFDNKFVVLPKAGKRPENPFYKNFSEKDNE